jgi:hypothetical protein
MVKSIKGRRMHEGWFLFLPDEKCEGKICGLRGILQSMEKAKQGRQTGTEASFKTVGTGLEAGDRGDGVYYLPKAIFIA